MSEHHTHIHLSNGWIFLIWMFILALWWVFKIALYVIFGIIFLVIFLIRDRKKAPIHGSASNV